MKLIELSAENYRVFTAPQVCRFATGLNPIVGENNVGKSSVLGAILETITGGISPSNVSVSATGVTRTSVRIELNETERSAVANEIYAQMSPEGQSQFRNPETSDHKYLLRILASPMTLVSELNASAPNNYVEVAGGKFVDQGLLYAPHPWHSAEESLRLGCALDTPLSQVALKEKWSIMFPIRPAILRSLSTKVLYFQDIRHRPQSLSNAVLASFDGTGTANVLHTLRNSPQRVLRKKYELIRSTFETMFPGFTYEVTGTLGESILIQFSFRGVNADIPQSQVGAGIIQALTFLTNLLARRDSLALIEEPESHLHPHGQRALRAFFESVSREGNQIIFTTHSCAMVSPQLLPSTCRVQLSSGKGNVFQLRGDARTIDRIIGENAVEFEHKVELLFSRAALLTEDDTQALFIREICRRFYGDPDSYSLSIVSVGGDSRFVPYARFLEGMGIPFRGLADKRVPAAFTQQFFQFGKEIEEALHEMGAGPLFEQAKAEWGQSKPRQIQYVGTLIERGQVPEIALKALESSLALCGWMKP